MLGLMQSQPLLISSLIEFAERHHGDAEIVSRRVEGDIHRYTYLECEQRSRRLADGRTINVLTDWPKDNQDARFLRQVRDAACDVFSVVLSPDYNAAHADHFHLDQDDRWAGVCR